MRVLRTIASDLLGHEVKYAMLIVCVLFLLSTSALAEQVQDGKAHYDSRYYLNLWQPLAEQGSPLAQYQVGQIYQGRSSGYGSPDKAEAYFWYAVSAQAGSKISELARGFDATQITPAQKAQGDKRAAEWLKAHPASIRAEQLQEGEAALATQNYPEALKLLRPLAERGNAVAQQKMHDMGRKIFADVNARDTDGFLDEYDGPRPAKGPSEDDIPGLIAYAEAGHLDAQLELARHYFMGRAIPQDYAEACFWYSIIATNRDFHHQRGAQELRDISAKYLVPEEKAAVDKRVAAWLTAHAAATTPTSSTP